MSPSIEKAINQQGDAPRNSKAATSSRGPAVSTFATHGEYLQWLHAPRVNKNSFLPDQEKWLWEYVGPKITGTKINWDICAQEYYKMFNEKRGGDRLNLHWYYVDRKRKSAAEAKVKKEDKPVVSTGKVTRVKHEAGGLGDCLGAFPVEPSMPEAGDRRLGLGVGEGCSSWFSGSNESAEEVLHKALGGDWKLESPPIDSSALQIIASAALDGPDIPAQSSWGLIDEVQVDPRLLGGPSGSPNLAVKQPFPTYTWVPGDNLPSANALGLQHEYCQLEATGCHAQAPEDPHDTSFLHVYTASAAHIINLGNSSQERVYFGPLGISKSRMPTAPSQQLNEILNALRLIPLHRGAIIYSDSRYAVNCVTVWCIQWARRGWVEKNGKAVQSRNLIQDIVSMIERRSEVGSRTMFEWVKGVNGE